MSVPFPVAISPAATQKSSTRPATPCEGQSQKGQYPANLAVAVLQKMIPSYDLSIPKNLAAAYILGLVGALRFDGDDDEGVSTDKEAVRLLELTMLSLTSTKNQQAKNSSASPTPTPEEEKTITEILEVLNQHDEDGNLIILPVDHKAAFLEGLIASIEQPSE